MTAQMMTLKEYQASVRVRDIAAANCAEYVLAADHRNAKLCAEIYQAEQNKQDASSAAIETCSERGA